MLCQLGELDRRIGDDTDQQRAGPGWSQLDEGGSGAPSGDPSDVAQHNDAREQLGRDRQAHHEGVSGQPPSRPLAGQDQGAGD